MSDDEAPKAEQSEDWTEKVGKVLEGAEALNTLREAAELLELLEGAAEASAALGTLLEACAIGGPIVAMLAALWSVLEADETEEKLAGARGFAFGLAWGVLGKGTPSATCGGANELFPDRVQSEQEKFNKGASEGASKGAEQQFKNRCLVWMSKNSDDGTQLLRHFFTEAASKLGYTETISELASNLNVDSPVC